MHMRRSHPPGPDLRARAGQPTVPNRDDLVDFVRTRGGVHGNPDGPSLGRRLARDRDIASDADERPRPQRLGDTSRSPIGEQGLGR